ncbi:hypothetical protein LOAG_03863 [Loa loa]|uniref:N-acetyl-D-glucosamine kinase n=2 Tax=Loa loa TaxID=7209 RepID=A0A1S0U3G8_LOALO|nr:hypothetical protein LOAG_03863 [Loa loa]EFO24625.2 hypothetical protein LOAG_03863 [Loa loa]
MEASRIFAGIEGGATQSRLLFIDETGKRYGEWSQSGLNCCLDGFDVIADRIAKWIQMAKKEVGIVGPLAAVGMGLSGAEDEENNQRLIGFLKDQHGDIAVEFSLSSDAVVAVAASFQNGGTVMVAGTGSACRLLKADGNVYGVGGWGHEIGDGGSAFWIARRLIRYIFDEEDGLYPSPYPISKTKRLFLEFFGLCNKAGILEVLYTNFDKSRIASFAAHVAKEASDDPLIRQVFRDAGEQLGLHVRAISRNFDEEMFDDAPLLLIGSVWQSWELLKDGFIHGLKSNGSQIGRVTLYNLLETPALGAALLAAKKLGKKITCEQRTAVFEEMSDENDILPGQKWIMCNICCRSASISSSRVKFYLTKCGHIFCSKCLISIGSSRDGARVCLYCKEKITICKISRDMPEAVQTYFRCPRELLTESMVEIMQVIKFQTMHAAYLVKRFNIMQNNYEKLRRFCCEILHKKTVLERQLMGKVKLPQHNNISVNDMSTPILRSTTSAKNLHSMRNVGTSKTSVTSESISKSGTESSVIENSTCSLNESVVVDMAEISVKNSVVPRTSHANQSTW